MKLQWNKRANKHYNFVQWIRVDIVDCGSENTFQCDAINCNEYRKIAEKYRTTAAAEKYRNTTIAKLNVQWNWKKNE